MTHQATHVPGQPVRCTCGWQTPRPVPNADAGVKFAQRHMREVRGD